ncbi:MAG: type I-C CRISPR-associated protein Cas8c/Csd1 [bacterium]
MILGSLVNYYNLLAEDGQSDIPRRGYSEAKVSYALNLSEAGELLNLIPLKVSDFKGKKMIPQVFIVPEQKTRTSGVNPYFLCDNSQYILGFNNKKVIEKNKFDACKAFHEKILQDTYVPEAKAVLRFFNSWDMDKAQEHSALEQYLDDIYKGANFIFKLTGKNQYLHDNKEIIAAWLKYLGSQEKGVKGICSVTGEKKAIARLHPLLKGIRGGKSTGNSLVSFNASAYESYGCTQGFNASVSEDAAFAYGTALNRLLAEEEYKLYYSDSTVVFWANSRKPVYRGLFSSMLKMEEPQQEEEKVDCQKREDIKNIFKKLYAGIAGDYAIDEKTDFFILGLSPNAARASVRFFIKNSFKNIMDNVQKYYEDLLIEKQSPKNMDLIPLWKVLSETVSSKATKKEVLPALGGAVFRAMIEGRPYPEILYYNIMLRIRCEKEINYYKAAIIKAYLLRKNSLSSEQKEVLTMSLNENSEDKAYVLGRMFAILEKAQLDANKGIKSTIKDRYFASACASPASIFPALLKLANHHIAKADYGYKNDKNLTDVMEKLNVDDNPFPKRLSLIEQGIFMLGYYHQKNNLYPKKEEN